MGDPRVTDAFATYLRSHNLPVTEQRLAVADVVLSADEHLSAEEVENRLAGRGVSVGTATVYRTLLELVKGGLLKKIEIGSRTVYDHDYGYPQHEHLVCDQCKSMIEFQHPGIEVILQQIAAEHQFRAEGHTLVVRGICASCNRANAMKRRPYAIA